MQDTSERGAVERSHAFSTTPGRGAGPLRCAVLGGPCYTPAMMRFRTPAATLALIGLLAITIATSWFVTMPTVAATVSQSGEIRSAVAVADHDVFVGNTADRRPASGPALAVIHAALPAPVSSTGHRRLLCAPSVPRSTAIALRLPPLRV